MSRLALALVLASSTIFAAGCAADPGASADDDGASSEDALSAKADEHWMYAGPMPALKDAKITVSLDKVKELRTHGSFAVLKKDVPLTRKDIEQVVQPGKVGFADGSIQVDTASGLSSSVPANDLSFIIDEPTFHKLLQPQSLLRGWKGALTAGATDVQATNYGTTFNLGLNLVRLAPSVGTG